MAKIGFIGLGKMGAPMALNLIKAGHALKVFDLAPDGVARAVDAGAEKAASANEAASGAEAVVTMLPAGSHVGAVYLGSDGILAAAAPGTLFIDCSTIDVATARDVAGEAATAGMAMIDAPVSGGVPGAEKGTLAIMAGGEQADFDAVKDVVAHLSSRFTLMGPSGAGQTTKLVNQIVVSATIMTLAEAFAFAERAGVDPARIPEALKGGWADSL
ncbi:MAG: NAD-binding protein, partial [Rhodomicrobium sp.]|nr:NAD-binding protein [Rhodomicrobium sp.]